MDKSARNYPLEDIDREELRDALRARRDRLAISARELAARRDRGVANGYISPIEASTMRRGVLHIETEIRWHDELDAVLAEGASLGGSAERRGGAAVTAGNGLELNRDITR